MAAEPRGPTRLALARLALVSLLRRRRLVAPRVRARGELGLEITHLLAQLLELRTRLLEPGHRRALLLLRRLRCRRLELRRRQRSQPLLCGLQPLLPPASLLAHLLQLLAQLGALGLQCRASLYLCLQRRARHRLRLTHTHESVNKGSGQATWPAWPTCPTRFAASSRSKTLCSACALLNDSSSFAHFLHTGALAGRALEGRALQLQLRAERPQMEQADFWQWHKDIGT